MEKKLWSNAEIVELGVENTKNESCSINFDDVEVQTDGVILGCIWDPSEYKKTSLLDRRCIHFDLHSPCFCKLKGQNLS